MYRGSYRRKPGKRGIRMNRAAVLLIAVILLMGVAVGATAAFLIAETGSRVNSFAPGEVSCKISEDFDKTTKKNVQVENTGNVDSFIRAAYVVNWLDSDGNIVVSVPDGYSYDLTLNPDGNWTQGTDGYWYYNTVVAPGDLTEGSLLTCTVTYPSDPEYTLSVEILASAIQSNPSSAAQNAWGYTPSGT